MIVFFPRCIQPLGASLEQTELDLTRDKICWKKRDQEYRTSVLGQIPLEVELENGFGCV